MAHWGRVSGDCCRLCIHWQPKRQRCKRIAEKAGPFYLCDLFERKQEQLILFQNEPETGFEDNAKKWEN